MKIEEIVKQQIDHLFGDINAEVVSEGKSFSILSYGTAIKFSVEDETALESKDLKDLIGKEVTIDRVISDMETEVDKANDEERTLRMVGSTGEIDRMGDIIDVKGWKLTNYRKNPVILFGHDTWIPAVARAKEVKKEDDKLTFLIEFPPEGVNDLSDKLFNLYKLKIMRASSVGFLPLKYDWIEDENGRYRGIHFIEQELLELSLVNVPAHPAALAMSLYGKGINPQFAAMKIGIDVEKMQEALEPLKNAIEEYRKWTEEKADEINKALQYIQNFELSQKLKSALDEIKRSIKEVR
ncbi:MULTISPECIES: hypothetical protein [unclassified Mesotoga]|uniref:hypothetical protein n=1 Tax=unclassified Mesotoga TaxID=1184398 RepID=UPI000DA65C63|nr:MULTISPECIES: hypothetical protein [unclassified Mesotoga]PZC52325.1 hypothetical protein LH53_05780 [Mesotoga sp. TolDC]